MTPTPPLMSWSPSTSAPLISFALHPFRGRKSQTIESMKSLTGKSIWLAQLPGLQLKLTEFSLAIFFIRLVVEQSEQREKEDDQEAKKDGTDDPSTTASINPEDVPGGGGIGSISFVSCATGGVEVAQGDGSSNVPKVGEQPDSMEDLQEKGSLKSYRRGKYVRNKLQSPMPLAFYVRTVCLLW